MLISKDKTKIKTVHKQLNKYRIINKELNSIIIIRNDKFSHFKIKCTCHIDTVLKSLASLYKYYKKLLLKKLLRISDQLISLLELRFGITYIDETTTPIARENPFLSSPEAAIKMFANALSSGLYNLRFWSAK